MTDRSDGVSRRTFVSIAATSAATAALAGCTSSGDEAEPVDGGDDNQSDNGGNDQSNGDDGGDTSSGGSTVIVGPGGATSFDPEELTVSTGTTVTFEWDSDFHNVVPTSQPDGANWSGQKETKNSGFTYEYTFEVAGTYEYVCEPHESAGMTGTIVVE
ncbi:Plastocyanin [Natronoarchaeum philippinense]|uniref:Plastocyanin n=1 Tax=Natronoarchaeum philippinense TaxID=558529 RepID=A0A285N475_NATPI|nr:plastocyanin/azurin family copper-binding protein [Natronoarchaeum philippinense]SNZ04275.1 Plastocyanin [Natronoarchaeum philippinense]